MLKGTRSGRTSTQTPPTAELHLLPPWKWKFFLCHLWDTHTKASCPIELPNKLHLLQGQWNTSLKGCFRFRKHDFWTLGVSYPMWTVSPMRRTWIVFISVSRVPETVSNTERGKDVIQLFEYMNERRNEWTKFIVFFYHLLSTCLSCYRT